MGFGRYRFRRSFGQVASQFRGAIPKHFPLFKGLLGLYPGAAAAYSLRALNSNAGNVVRVRRDSDNEEKDFTASDVADGTLENWFNATPEATTAQNSTSLPYSTFTNASTTGFTATLSSGSAFGGFGGVSGLSGDSVTVAFDLDIVSGSPFLALREGTESILAKSNSQVYTSSGSYSLTMTATESFAFIGFSEGDNPSEFTVSNFKITAVTGQDGFVETWYDQSGNGNNATQLTAGSQPKIVDNGSLITDANGNPWLDLLNATNGNIGLDLDSNVRSSNGASSVFCVSKLDQIFTGTNEYQNIWILFATQRALISNTGSTFYKDIAISDAREVAGDDAVYVRFPATLTNHSLLSSIYDGVSTTSGSKPDINLHVNGSEKSSTDGSSSLGVPSTGNNSIGYRIDTNSQGVDGKLQEFIVYDTDQSANRAGIEANINDYYDI